MILRLLPLFFPSLLVQFFLLLQLLLHQAPLSRRSALTPARLFEQAAKRRQFLTALREFPLHRIWLYKKTNWPEIMKAVVNYDWWQLHEGSIDQTVNLFYNVIQNVMSSLA